MGPRALQSLAVLPLRGFYIALHSLTLRLKMAQKPYIIWSLGPEALKYESLEP